MKFTYSWLLRHLDTEAPLERILETLTSLGLEVEGCHNPADALRTFMVAEIQSAEPHPNADRLRVCQVFDGSETRQIVCGAPNARAGIKVVLAKPGTVIPANGMTIKVGKIRDVESGGMLCSSDELGLSDGRAEGILELGADAQVGAALVDVLALDDPLIEIGLTPNRADCTGVRGVARDLAAAGLGTLKPLEFEEMAGAFKAPQTVTLTHKSCSYYLGRLIKNIKNEGSPAFVQRYLKAIGLEPISAVVDFTNFITHDIGRPAHVYDAQKISKDLVGRAAQPGEALQALNKKSYTLTEEDGVIADASGVLGLAGIIGSEPSGCSFETTDVFLELAYFDPVSISLSGRHHSIVTDSRYRMERGVDKRGCEVGMAYLTHLITTYCGGEVSEIIVAGTPPALAEPIEFSVSLIEKRLGLTVPLETVIRILETLGMTVEKKAEEALTVTPPSWRPDIAIPEDLVEEVIRVYGYNHIPTTCLPAQNSGPVVSVPQQKLFQLKTHLASRGLNESINWAMIPEPIALLFGQTDARLKINNPITQELAWMRPSLVCQLLEDMKRKLNKGYENLHIFESGRVFQGPGEREQPLHLAGVRQGLMSEETWHHKPEPADLYSVKKDLFACLDVAGLTPEKLMLSTDSLPSWYHPGRAAAVMLGPKVCLGYFGQIHPTVQKAYDLAKPVYAFEVHLDKLPMKAPKSTNKGLLKTSKFQAIHRDFSFFVEDSVELGSLVRAMGKADPRLVSQVSLFDVYQGKGVPEGKISVSIRLVITPQERTLTEDEIKPIYDKAIALATAIEGVEFRL